MSKFGGFGLCEIANDQFGLRGYAPVTVATFSLDILFPRTERVCFRIDVSSSVGPLERPKLAIF
jgi:hypothetical protein